MQRVRDPFSPRTRVKVSKGRGSPLFQFGSLSFSHCPATLFSKAVNPSHHRVHWCTPLHHSPSPKLPHNPITPWNSLHQPASYSSSPPTQITCHPQNDPANLDSSTIPLHMHFLNLLHSLSSVVSLHTLYLIKGVFLFKQNLTYTCSHMLDLDKTCIEKDLSEHLRHAKVT